MSLPVAHLRTPGRGQFVAGSKKRKGDPRPKSRRPALRGHALTLRDRAAPRVNSAVNLETNQAAEAVRASRLRDRRVGARPPRNRNVGSDGGARCRKNWRLKLQLQEFPQLDRDKILRDCIKSPKIPRQT